ncbi:hypothetical protein ACWJKU_10910 [Methylocaldum sp. MU1018]
MKVIRIYPSFGPMIYIYTVWVLFFVSLLMQEDGSQKHMLLLLCWILFLVILVIKDLLDWLVWKKYLPIMCFRDNEIDVQRREKVDAYDRIPFDQIKKISFDRQSAKLSIYLINGRSLSVDLYRLRRSKQKEVLEYIEQRMPLQ